MLGTAFFDHSSARPNNGAFMIHSSTKKWTRSRGAEHLYTVCLPYFYFIQFQPLHTTHSEIATTMHELEIRKSSLQSDPEKLKVLFKEMIQVCLWYVSD
jgi:hypothetical protein